MRNYTFNWEVRTLIAQFMVAFNDVVIKRYNQDKEAQDQIHVNFVYAPKNRVIHDLVNKAAHIKLPVIAVSLGGLQRDESRVFNKLEGPYYSESVATTGFSHTLQPVPVNITVNMSIITRFQTDMDQILTNFIPYNDPYVIISWRDPYLGHEIRSPVIWDQNIGINYPTDISHTDYYRCISDTSFTINGWLFKDQENAVGKIYSIETTYTGVSDIFSDYDAMVGMQSELATDTFVISARPTVTLCTPYATIPCTPTEFVIQGNQYDYVTNMYASGSPEVFSDATYYNPLSGNSSLSASYPGFSGVPITNWTKYNNNLMTINLPQAISAGSVDVIALNEAGYGILTKDARVTTTNPYVSGTPAYNSYVEYQHPSVSGIQIGSYYYNCT